MQSAGKLYKIPGTKIRVYVLFPTKLISCYLAQRVVFMTLNSPQFMMRTSLPHAQNTFIPLTMAITLPSDEAPFSASAHSYPSLSPSESLEKNAETNPSRPSVTPPGAPLPIPLHSVSQKGFFEGA